MENDKIKVQIFLDGSWCEVPYDELKNYEFRECIITEYMTKEEYNKRYIDIKGYENGKI
jgi:hypothetical protein